MINKNFCPTQEKLKDFNQEERQVVDDFCGEAKYNDFMKNKGYYLVDTNTLLLDNNNKKIKK